MATGDDLAHTNTWTDEVPADVSNAKALGINIRRQVLDVEERMKAEHYWNGSGDASTEDDGRHKPGSVSCLANTITRALEAVGTGHGQIQKFSDEGGIWVWDEEDQEWQHVPPRMHVITTSTNTSVGNDDDNYDVVAIDGATKYVNVKLGKDESVVFLVRMSVLGADGRITVRLYADTVLQDTGHFILSLGAGSYQMCKEFLVGDGHALDVNTEVKYEIKACCTSGLSSATIDSSQIVIVRYQ